MTVDGVNRVTIIMNGITIMMVDGVNRIIITITIIIIMEAERL